MNDTPNTPPPPAHYTHPKLREPIEVRFEHFDDNPIILIRCPIGVSTEPLGLRPEAAPLLQRFNGAYSVDAIQQELAEQGATHEIILQLAETLDEALFLEGPKYHAALDTMQKQFLESPVRPAALAGLSYAGEPQKLTEELNAYLAIGDQHQTALMDRPLRMLMTPHIDYQRGAECYGRSFVALRNQQPDVILLLGTSHQYSDHIYHLTKKDFATPLGGLKNHSNFTTALAKRYGESRSYADEMLHKQEHSLELQIPFIKYLVPNAEIVPILVGGFHSMIAKNVSPSTHEPYQSFLEALAETIQQELIQKQRSFMVLAGVDMAHVGSYFGDEQSLTQDFLVNVRNRDEQYLRCLFQHNTNDLFQHIAEDQDSRRICGFPTMYTILDLFKLLNIQTTNKLLDYRQAVNWQTDCAVTFAGMAFYE